MRRRRREAHLRRSCRATGSIAFASSLDQIGPFATTVADAALLLDVIAGHDPLDSTSIAGAHAPVLADARTTASRACASAIVDELIDADGIQPEVRDAVERAPRRAREGGRDRRPGVACRARSYGLSAYYLIAPAEASSNLARYDGVRYGLRVDGDDVGHDERAHARRRASAPR